MEVRIVEAYKEYEPPFDATKAVRKLLEAVPEKYLRELDCVVLTNLNALSRKQRLGTLKSRKRRVPKLRIRGLYHGKWQGKPPWIEIRVDKAIALVPKALAWIPLVRELSIAEVLYHELGHHIHLYVRPEHREKEDVADDWRRKLSGNYVRKRYGWVAWLFALAFKLRRLISRAQTPGESSGSDQRLTVNTKK
jgi:hypothetical protein